MTDMSRTTEQVHERNYRRAVEAVQHAVSVGLVTLPQADPDAPLEDLFGDQVDPEVLRVAEYFMSALR